MREIEIYGEIGYEVTAKRIAEELKNEEEVAIRINSYGGDVFEAQAIYNQLKGRVSEVRIDGICASAATLIACSGKRIKMPSNALYMIHLPSTLLIGYYNEIDIEKTRSRLSKVTGTILNVYSRKTGKTEEEMREMVAEETWLSAEEAKAVGFIDEVEEEDPGVENRLMTIRMEVNEGRRKTVMENEAGLFEKFKNWLKKEEKESETIAAERGRIEELSRVETKSIGQRAIIELAKRDGRTLSDIQSELDAIGLAEKEAQKKREKEYESQSEYVFKAIRDYMRSNAESIKSGIKSQESDEIQEVVKYAEELRK